MKATHYCGAMIIASVFLALLPFSTYAFSIPPNDGFLTDAAGFLYIEEDRRLEEKLATYQKETGREIVIVVSQKLDGTDIAKATQDIQRKWNVGKGGSGAFLLIAREEAQLLLVPGESLASVLPEPVINGIIATDIQPSLRAGKTFDALNAGIDAIEKHIAGAYTADRYRIRPSYIGAKIALTFLFLLSVLAAFYGRSTPWWLGSIVGLLGGTLFTELSGWWWSIPLLLGGGVIVDVLCKKGTRKRRRYA